MASIIGEDQKRLGPYQRAGFKSGAAFYNSIVRSVDQFKAAIGIPNRIMVTQTEFDLLSQVIEETLISIADVPVVISSYPSRETIEEAVVFLQSFALRCRPADLHLYRGSVHTQAYGK